MSNEPCNHTKLFQQAIETTITCLSIIKYNSTLSEEQKTEILAEINSTLTFLEARCAATTAIENQAVLPTQKPATDAPAELGKEALLFTEDSSKAEQELRDLSLKNLYRLYHSYLDNKRIAHLETRYRMVMGVLEQLEQATGQQHDLTAGDLTTERMLHRIRGFVTALYCMFREFAVVFSHLVDGKNIETDTEALTPLDKYPSEEKTLQMLRDITPLLRIYTRHRQLQERRGFLTKRAADAIAFLIFLEENLQPTSARRNEIIAQIKSIASLLNDLTRLLVKYEQAMSTLKEA
jgi:hypothetical protein